MELIIHFKLSLILLTFAMTQIHSQEKKTELSLKPEGSKTFKDLKDNLDFDIE